MPISDHKQKPPAEFPGFTRRELLARIAAAGLGTLLPLRELRAQTGVTGAGRLDVHHHFGSPRWIKWMAEVQQPGWDSIQTYTPAKSIEAMDSAGIQTAFLSCTEPGIWAGDDFAKVRAEAIALARDMNEYGTRMKSDYKGRFGLFAVLPLPDVEASLKEIEYAFDTLHAEGVGVLTSYGNIWLGDDKLQPVFDELNRRSAVVYVHPTDSTCCHALANAYPATVEWQSDTGRSINSIVSTALPYYGPPMPARNGPAPTRESAATRYANVKFIWAHGGGTLLTLANRLIGRDSLSAEALAKPAAVNSKLYHLRRFYYDTAQVANPMVMQGLKMLVGASQIVFGTDFPYGGVPTQVVKDLTQCGFTAEELRGIDRENALRFLPKYRGA